ncbi:PREDICTED: uncharacterized protein LOC109224201 [Nicotiana attenuata]|uniref:uncharacterized protein LOC109224201 n=1 Tax=Nicotiana attenuata TaxID=49451 RepID=UPI000905B3EF|nr:PREDICTED: uncharacterized protein LOC109224201 [Nicotiana attenuata]
MFTSAKFDRYTCTAGDEILTNMSKYQRLIGRLIYLTITRPDIVFVVQTLSQFMQEPKKSHWDAAIRVVKYLKREPGMGIFLSSVGADSLTCFCDADWASCPNTRRSVTGYLVKFGNSLISWKSKKHHTVSRRCEKTEYRSLGAVTAEVVWLLGLKAALQIVANPIFHERTKHIEIDCHFVRDKIKQGVLNTQFVGTEDQLLKVLESQHAFLLGKLGVLNILRHPA